MTSAEEQPLKTIEEHIDQNITLRDRINNIKQSICLEPLIICYAIPGYFIRLATQNLYLDKTCRVYKNYGDAVCDELIARQGSKYLNEELAVQQLVAALESWKSFLCTVVPCILILFIGAWSDSTKKRKICILVPIIGEVMMCLSYLLNVYYFHELPLQVAVFSEAFFLAITGGQITFFVGVFALLSDVTNEESRTFRMGVLNLCYWIALLIGSALSGVLLKHIGYYGVFSLCLCLYIFGIVYGYYFIEDPKNQESFDEIEFTQKSSKEISFLKSFFDFKHVKDTFSVAFKKGPNHRRITMIFILVSNVLMNGTASGELSVLYMFTRYRFNWDALSYSFYLSFKLCSNFLGIIAISFFSRHLKWNDAFLGLIAISSKTIYAVTTGMARNSTAMYIGAAVDIFTVSGLTALRSFSTKLCSRHELGKITSIFNLMEVMTSIVVVPMYTWVYMYTVEFDASITFYISTVLTIPNLFIFGWFHKQHFKSKLVYLHKKEKKDGEMREEEDAESIKEDNALRKYSH